MNYQNPNPIQPSDIVVALDIGTSKVCAIAGKVSKYGKLEILGIGVAESVGIARGQVSNIEKTVQAITEAVESCSRAIQMPIQNVHIGIAGQHIKCHSHRGLLTRDNILTEISRQDLDKLVDDMYKMVLPPGEKILHVIPQEYTVDNEQGVLDPIGMSGVRLEANFQIITGNTTAFFNLKKCVEKAGLHIVDLTLEPIAAAEAVLSDQEKQAGVVLVDIGGGTTDIVVFHEGIIRHSAVIPMGGNLITKDIKEGCKVMQPQAEKLKVKYGAALAEEVYENRVISIQGLNNRDFKEISEKNLAQIIEARLFDIFDWIQFELKKSGYDSRKLIAGYVLTGGGSMLKHIDKFAEYHSGMHTRIGRPVEALAHGYSEQMSSPALSTATGLLLRALKHNELQSFIFDKSNSTESAFLSQNNTKTKQEEKNEKPSEQELEESGSIISNLFHRVRNWFEAEPDTEL